MDSMEIRKLERALASAETKVRKASETRRALPVGSSRAKVTTANARWSTACEARDRILAAIDALKEKEVA